jgi:hypothetical protein
MPDEGGIQNLPCNFLKPICSLNRNLFKISPFTRFTPTGGDKPINAYTMKASMRVILLFSTVFFAVNVFSQNVGIGEINPGSKLSIKGGLGIGSDYSTLTAPSNGAIIEGTLGLGTSSPDTNAIIDMHSTSKGILLPRMNTVNRTAIVNPATGLLIFNTDSNEFNFYNGSSWTNLGLTGPTGAGYKGTTSSDLITISTGSKSITTQSGMAYLNNDRVRISNSSTAFMEGTVSSYTGTTLTVNVDYTAGSGSYSSWNIGIAGQVGATGATGTNGVTGATGPAGTNGTNGANGVTGPTGAQGVAGVAGATGATGANGTNGTNGSNGATGVAGATGPTGAAGTNGTNGTNGAKGATGSTGATGATGAAGTNGSNGTAGATGPTGAQGITGVTGPAGTNGTNGANGANGATGAAGANGTNGTNGSTGATGATGPTGAAGSTGTNGTNGANGATGATGKTGATGATGAAGSNGTNGTNGSNGATGATGATGILSSGSAAGNTPYWNGTSWVINSSNIFNNGGNVGINTSLPGYALDVSGDINLTGALRASGSAGTSGQVLTSTGSGLQWANASGANVGSSYGFLAAASTDPNTALGGTYSYVGEDTVPVSTGDVILTNAYFSTQTTNTYFVLKITRSQTAGSGTAGTTVGYCAWSQHDGSRYASTTILNMESGLAPGTWYYKIWVTGYTSGTQNYALINTKAR